MKKFISVLLAVMMVLPSAVFAAPVLDTAEETAVDTAGCVPWEHFEKVLLYTDLFLYDVKAFDDSVHKEYTSVSNVLILENLAKLLEKNHPLWVRIPIVTGVNDTVDEMENIKKFIYSHGSPERVDLLPYHAMGVHKSEALGKDGECFAVPASEKMKCLKSVFGI